MENRERYESYSGLHYQFLVYTYRLEEVVAMSMRTVEGVTNEVCSTTCS